MLTFKDNYDRNYFYSLMGKYFAERKYRKLMPYLYNEDELIWYLNIVDKEVTGFISYKDNGDKINIGYCYAEDNKTYKKNLNKLPNKNTYIELEKDFDKTVFEKHGFNVYKESKNYWYMELIIDENILK